MFTFFNLTDNEVTVNTNKLIVIQEQHFFSILSIILFSADSSVLITESNNQTYGYGEYAYLMLLTCP